jgi:hypothetical protein
MQVQSPCVVDFGDRTLVIGGALKVPNGGVLSLKAASITVRRAIIGRHTKPGDGAGASITLTASDSITVRWRIDASSRLTPGAIQLSAGGSIELFAPIHAATSGPRSRASGGTVEIDAGRSLIAVRRARIHANGAATTPGGAVRLNGGLGVTLRNRITAQGSAGGVIDIGSNSGSILVGERLDAGGSSGDGGSASIHAPTGSITTLAPLAVQGMARGGSTAVLGGGPVTIGSTLRARSTILAGPGGSVVVSSQTNVVTDDVIYANGLSGGSIAISAANGATRITAPLLANGIRTVGGDVQISGGTSASVESPVNADGSTQGGSIDVTAAAVSLTAHGSLSARGAMGGSINLSGAAVTVPLGARVLVDGDQPGGTITLAATGGDLILNGDFRARGRTGGRIQGTASGDVVAAGDFAARGNGCIGLYAGSQLDISGGVFDVPVVDQCP